MSSLEDADVAFAVLLHAAEAKLVCEVLIVKAERSIDLWILTFGPPSPLALVKILIVTSLPEPPPNTALVPPPNILTPLNLV